MTSLRAPVRANSLSRFSAPLESISCALFAKEPGRREVVHSLTIHLRGRFRFRFLKKDYPVVGAPAVAGAPARQDRFRESGIAVLTTSLGRHPWPGLEQKNATPSSYYVNPQVL